MLNNVNFAVHCYYSCNSAGRDFFVGDSHGKYSLLMQSLKKINFDSSVDRLFSVGDLIDRGEASFECLKLAEKEWFIPVIGNHEQFLLEMGDDNPDNKINWYLNGGVWWEALNEEQRKRAKRIVERNYSLTLTVATGAGEIGVIHAQYPFDKWPVNEKEISSEDYNELLWGRDCVKNDYQRFFAGVDFIVSGHTPVNKSFLKGQQLFIDTGCGHQVSQDLQDPRLTICEFAESCIKIVTMSERMSGSSSIQI
ncbi:metallophosphoesterase [Psychromonas sp. MB-3u-54]|uniref:metallophosphoesterase n=1 Tax=Psychromonas sp. MB-3u-54 TaxID=2058319 RepID=UPI000C34B931|nr:metallophosphoesterase [Psychromonas sp. MB-3u-54]PKH01966.1 metallophosphoesterase [Psychromonas sp. MB-3u-54]